MAIFLSHVAELSAVLQRFTTEHEGVDLGTRVIADAVVAGRTLFTCGNGGSAADAIHLSQELVGRYRSNRRPLASVCLNTDPGALTCIANDFGYDQIFSRPLEALGRSGDVLVAFSTSGNSPNILSALRMAHARGMISVALLGKGGGPARDLADHALVVPSDNTARIQEVHGLLIHVFCEAIEARTTPA